LILAVVSAFAGDDGCDWLGDAANKKAGVAAGFFLSTVDPPI
jgi:hypothetical protein